MRVCMIICMHVCKIICVDAYIRLCLFIYICADVSVRAWICICVHERCGVGRCMTAGSQDRVV